MNISIKEDRLTVTTDSRDCILFHTSTSHCSTSPSLRRGGGEGDPVHGGRYQATAAGLPPRVHGLGSTATPKHMHAPGRRSGSAHAVHSVGVYGSRRPETGAGHAPGRPGGVGNEAGGARKPSRRVRFGCGARHQPGDGIPAREGVDPPRLEAAERTFGVREWKGGGKGD